ncbi:MAG: hypothetical protein C5B49_14640 [Bdellovibrio sp.]|nr:MAG: hypothetical protein C5B49_14640 [Bdellovibrio sp.]
MVGDYTILLVDDDLLFCKAISSVLGLYYRVCTVGSIAEAKSAILAQAFDVILLDRGLPDGDAAFLIPLIKTQLPLSAVIMLSGDDREVSIKECFALGAVDYVLKASNPIPELLVRIPIAISNSTTATANLLQLPKAKDEISLEHYRAFLANAEKLYLSAAFDLCDSNLTKTSRHLGITRMTLFNRVRSLRLNLKKTDGLKTTDPGGNKCHLI